MPRLLFVVNHAGFFLSHRLPVALAARDAGYEVHAATPRSKHVPQLKAAGLEWHELPLSRSSINPFREWRTFESLCALYRELRPDIVHHVTSKPVLYGTVAARLTGVGGVVNAVAGLGHAYTDGGPMQRVVRWGMSRAYRFALRHRRMRVIIQNRDDYGMFIRQKWVRPDELVLVPGAGVDMQRFRPTDRRRGVPVRIVLASRLLYTKGVGEFVAAARELKRRGADAVCVIVGEPDADNPASVPIETLRGWQAEGSIEYSGRRDDMPAVLADADIVCLPTYYGEGLPKVLVEAAACGLPIVTTDWPGCREVVVNGENGFLVPVRNVEALTSALATLVSEPELRHVMGTRGRARVEADFSVESVVRRTVSLYTELQSAPSVAAV